MTWDAAAPEVTLLNRDLRRSPHNGPRTTDGIRIKGELKSPKRSAKAGLFLSAAFCGASPHCSIVGFA